MSLTPIRPLKRAAETPATGERRRTFQTPIRTPTAAGHEQRARYRGQTPNFGCPKTPLVRGLRASVNQRAYESSALRREYSVDRSVISSQVDRHDYLEEEELRDFQQDTILEEMKGLPAGTVLARDDFHQVVVHGSVPDEVRHALHDVDFASDQYRAVVDAFTGFAAVSTPQAVYVWNYAKKTFASPTCYIFHPPTPSPFVAIIPSQIPHSREPGIILVDSVTPDSNGGSGEVLLYDNVTLALTGAQAIKGRLGLKEAETVTGLHRVDAITMLVLTDHARVLRQTISTNDSRPVLNLPTPFVKPNNAWLSRSTDAIFTGTREQGILGVSIGKEDVDNSLLASSTTSSLGVSMFMGTPRRHRIVEPNVALNGIGMKREVWALGNTSASGWSLTTTDAKYLKEISILAELESHSELTGHSDIRLQDIATLEHGNIAVLCVCSLGQAGRSKKSVGAVSYAVAVINPAKGPGEVIEHLVKLNYSGVEDPRPVAKAKLAVPQKANIAFVQLSAAVITVSLERDSLYQQSTTFKDPVHNPIIDIGFDRRPIVSRVGKASEGYLRMTAFAPRSGFMGIEIDPVRLFEYQPGTTSLARQEQLENKIEQSVFFDGAANPVSFSLQTGSSTSLEQAVLSVSEKVLSSSSTYLNGELDNASLLEERRKRLSHLIQVVRQMGLLDDISQPVRKQLAEDATVVAIAQDLYHLLPTDTNHVVTETPDQLLVVAINDLVSAMPSHTDDDDALAVFFVKEVRGISKLLQRLPSLVQRCIATLPDDALGGVRNWSASWHKHACLILQAAMQHAVTVTRQENLEVYELDTELYDGKPTYLMDKETIVAFQYFYFKAAEDVKKIVNASKATLDSNETQDQQLAILAENLLLNELQEVLRALAVPLLFALEEQANLEASVIEGKQDQRIAIRVKDQLIRDSHEAIMALVFFDSDLAFHVAEMFERHYTLAQLSVKVDVGSPERIASYMEGQFGRPELSADLGYRFSQELFAHYLSERQYYSILQYSKEYGTAVSDFLRREGRNDLAWLQFLEESDFLKTGNAALKAADATSSAHSQQILLSVVKLTRCVMKAHGKDSTALDVADLDKRLVMLKTADLLRNRIRKSGVSSNIERTAQSFMAGRMTRLTEARLETLSELCHSNVIHLLRGQSVDPESLIELLTTKDIKDEQDAGDFITAMKVLRDWQQQAPAATRRQTVCLRSIWRRLYLANDWSVLKDPTETDAAKHKWLGRSKLLQVLIMMRGELSSDFIVSPRSAAVPPAMEDLRERFGPTEPVSLDMLLQDFEEESKELAGMDGLNDTVVSDLTSRAVMAHSG